METKKTTKANLEKNKTMNLLMGVVVALSLLFVSFEWGTQEVRVFDDPIPFINPDEPLPPITPPDEPVLPPPPPARVEVPDILVEVPDDAPDDSNADLGTESDDEPSPIVPPGFDNYVDKGETAEDEIFVIVETMPEFPGGATAMMSFIAKSINYPVTAIERGIEGSVICSFVIDKDGSITDIEIVRGIDVSLDKEASRVIGMMPKWSPGMQRDKAVRVKYTMPIRFRLQK